ncbi:TonB-dependent receptor [Altererythrobacter sp. ZODW24]|uniref:TonB-dependent receptor plug domain-containing protein n=1 Tax=Altererythrobacter sp. ZODW24 TaxID=2185142 RepID=UPI001F082A09|nr:TonB-dependent receptor [Altererythrobacter sp. ZODW24]
MRLTKLKLGVAIGALAFCTISVQAKAQDDAVLAPAIEAEAAAIASLDDVAAPLADAEIFEPAYFDQFAPRNALEMLRRIPGFDIRDDGQDRGLGQASTNVLVNGERLSGKSEGPRAQVSRISSTDVVRIELVDGATLDIPGLTGQVANLIVKVGKMSGQFEWAGELRPLTDRYYFGRFEGSVTGATGDLEYTVSLAHRGFRGGAQGPVTIVDGMGDLIETQDFSNHAGRDSPKITGAFKYSPSTSSAVANLNLSWQGGKFTQRASELIDGITSLDRDRLRVFENNDPEYEIGGDVEFALGPGRLKLIGLERFEKDDFAETVTETYFNGDNDAGNRFAAVSEEGERIGRAEYSWAMGGAEWQVSGEAAFNRLNRVAALFEVDDTGTFVEVDFPDNTAGVTEDRYNGAISYGRPIAENLTLQLIAGVEYSKLSQTGRDALTRKFWRPKGSANLAWAAGSGFDVSLQFERAVGQLSFGSFLASVQLNDNITDVGNSNLVPEQSWNTDLEIKKSLGKWGSATLRLFDRQIEDLVENVPIAGGGESPGNIDKAWRHGLELDSTIQLDPLGIKGGRLDISVELQESSVADPLDGTKRPLSFIEHRELSLGYRHDVPKSSWAYGADLYHNKRGKNFRLTEFSQENEGPLFLSMFLEHKDVLGMTVNVSASNLLGADVDYRRVVYDGFRNDSDISSVEAADLKFGRIFRFNVSGSF